MERGMRIGEPLGAVIVQVGQRPRSPTRPIRDVNRRATVTPDRRAILTPPVGLGGLIHALSTAHVPHRRAERWAKGG